MKAPSLTQREQAQDSTWRPAVLVAWLIARNGALVVRIRELEEENARLRSERVKPRRTIVLDTPF